MKFNRLHICLLLLCTPFAASENHVRFRQNTEANFSSYTDDNNTNSLQTTLFQAAGVYVDTNKSTYFSLQRTIIVTVVNYGFLNLLHNFDCFLSRLGLKYLSLSFDTHTHVYLRTRGKYSFHVKDPVTIIFQMLYSPVGEWIIIPLFLAVPQRPVRRTEQHISHKRI